MSGTRWVRLAFLDEAGISSPKNEPYTVVAGVLIHADEDWLPLERRLQAMAARALPDDPEPFLHTTDIYSGRKQFHASKGWDANRRFAILDELASLPEELELPVVYGFFERSNVHKWITPGGIQDPLQLAHMLAAARCLMQVERAMRQISNDEICSIVMENTQHSRQVLKDSQRFFRNPPADFVDETNKGWLPLTRIRGTPQFEDKADASLLQMADFCSFVIKRQLMRAPKIERFFGPLRRWIGFGYTKDGPSHPLFDPWEPSPERSF